MSSFDDLKSIWDGASDEAKVAFLDYVNGDDLCPARGARLAAGQIFDEQFWPLYPSRENNRKKPARDKFINLVVIHRTPVSEIIDGVKRYAISREGQDPQYTLMAQTFLNQEAWKTNFTAVNKSATRRTAGDIARELFDVAQNQSSDLFQELRDGEGYRCRDKG